MALTILQEPTSPNVSSTNLIYTVSSSNVPQFQYRYIADLYYSGSATKLARFKYPQNSSGTANIDLARPIGDYLSTDYNWATAPSSTTEFYSSSLTANTFTIKFGEEYGTSYNSAVTTFENEASASIAVLKGNIQYPTPSDFDGNTGVVTIATSSINFNSLPYAWDPSTTANTDISGYSDGTLSNNPNMLNGPATSKYYTEQNIFGGALDTATRKTVYNNTGSIGWYVAQPIGTTDIGTETYYYEFNSASLGTLVQRQIFFYDDNNTQIFYGIQFGYNVDQGLVTIPVGIEQMGNIENSSSTKLSDVISGSAQWSWYRTRINVPGTSIDRFEHYYYNEDKGPEVMKSYDSTIVVKALRPGLWQSGKYYPTYCNNEKTRFAFINSFGVWDYYNVYMPTRRVTKIDRKMYEQSRINLNDRIATYNVSNRGELQYYTEYTDEFEITTDIIDDKESQWLREMFESTEVYIQSGSDFIPINILNNQETIINNKARNKNYQYTIRYQFSNLREPR